MTSKPSAVDWAKQIVATLAAIVIALPFLWMLSTSLKGPAELALRDPTLVPVNPAPQNFARVLLQGQFGLYFLNTTIVALVTTLLSVACASLAGYAFARFRLPGGKPILLAIVATQMFPAILLACRCTSCCRRSI